MSVNEAKTAILNNKTALGIEFGSTRIKAVLVDDKYDPIASGSYEWENRYENGVWTYAAEADGQDFYDTDFSGGCAIVLGGEDSGVSRLVRERCDYTVSIPMYGKLNSLNVSTAASVLLCHAARMQRIQPR